MRRLNASTLKKGGGWFGSSSDNYNYGAQSTLNATEKPLYLVVLYYFLASAIAIILILTTLHYTVMPIWKTTPGGQGVIPLPGSDDTFTTWQKKPFQTLDSAISTPLNSTYQNWSGTLDIIIDDPTKNMGSSYRLLMWRGNDVQQTTGDTILSQIQGYNLAIYLDRATNDLFISTLVKGQNEQQPEIMSVLISNPPTRRPIRIGWMLGERVLEVYMNGHLVKSKTFTKPLLPVTSSSFYPIKDTLSANVARIQVLQLWNRPLTAAEFRANGQPSSFDTKELSDSCLV